MRNLLILLLVATVCSAADVPMPAEKVMYIRDFVPMPSPLVASGPPAWFVTVTNTPHPDTGEPLGIVAFAQGSDTIWTAVVGPIGHYTHWQPIKKTFRIASYPISLGGAVVIQPDDTGPPAEQLWQSYSIEYLNNLSREILNLRKHMQRWRASPTLPWPPR